MKVLKFGGTSVGSAQRIKNVASIVCDQEQKIVVLSAMAGTTNSLVEISECFHKKDPEKANPFCFGTSLCQSYRRIIPERCLQGKSHAIHARTVSTCLVFLKYAFQRIR